MPSQPVEPKQKQEEYPPSPTEGSVEEQTDQMSAGMKVLLIALVLSYLSEDDESPNTAAILALMVPKIMAKWSAWCFNALQFQWASSKHEQNKKTKEVETFLDEWAQDHARTLRARAKKHDTDISAITSADVSEWAEQAADGAAARVASETILDLGEKSNNVYTKDGVPVVLKKVWITRSDDRVRTEHRILHGRAQNISEPFKSWPTGEELQYPGDPHAPMDQIMGCRCFLWFTWGPKN